MSRQVDDILADLLTVDEDAPSDGAQVDGIDALLSSRVTSQQAAAPAAASASSTAAAGAELGHLDDLLKVPDLLLSEDGLAGHELAAATTLMPSAHAAETTAVSGPADAKQGQASEQMDLDLLLQDLLMPQEDVAGPASATDHSVVTETDSSGFDADAGSQSLAVDAAANLSSGMHPAAHLGKPAVPPDTAQAGAPAIHSVEGPASVPASPGESGLNPVKLHEVQHHQQQQQQQVAEHLTAASDDEDDLFGDMLHDMAEVLEDEALVAAEQPPPMAMPQAAAATAPAAAVAAVAAAAPALHEPATLPEARNADHLQHHQQLQSTAFAHASAGQQAAVVATASMEPHQALPSLPATARTAGAAAPAAAGDSATTALPPHEVALQKAWQHEEALVHGDLADSAAGPTAAGDSSSSSQQSQRHRLAPLPRLQELLSDALSDWNPAGRPDASGTAMIGGGVLLRLESLAGLFAAGTAAAGANVDWSQVLPSALAPHGQLQVVAASGQYLAVGSSSGSTLVFQFPVAQGLGPQHGQGSGAGPQNPGSSAHMGPGHSTLPGGAAMWQLGGHSGGLGFDPVSSLGFSVVGAAGEPLWLAVGHASGALTVWELQKRGPKQVAGIAQHGCRLTFTSFIPGRGTGLLLSGDVRGRCCLHTFSASLLRTSVASRPLFNGEYGPLLAITHLAPFGMPAPTQQPAKVAAGAVAGSGYGGLGGHGPGQWPDEAGWRLLCEDGSWRVGEGVCCITTPTHAYIGRLRPSHGDLVMLYSIPQPSPGVQQTAVPVAAWLPHTRKQAGSYCRLVDDMLMPVAILALGWGSRLVLFEVSLLGDQLTAVEATTAAAAVATAVAAATQQSKRSQGSAAAASRLMQQHAEAALEALNPATAAALAARFSLSICATWSGGPSSQSTPVAVGEQPSSGQPSHSQAQQQQQQLGQEQQQQQQQQQPVMGPAEPLPVLGVHWLDADALAVVCQQGFSSLLLVLGLSSSSGSNGNRDGNSRSGRRGSSPGMPASLRVQEQVEWMDQPVDREWGKPGVGAGGLLAWGADCGGSVVGSGARMYLLGQQGGVFCGRLMPWSERLKTLQDVQKYKLGLYFALRFYLTMQQQQLQSSAGVGGTTAGSTRRLSLGGFARSEGIGAEPQQMQQWLLSLMLGHASASLQAAATAAAACKPAVNGPQQVPQDPSRMSAAAAATVHTVASSVAEVCVCACLLLGRPDVLFGRVFQLFAQQSAVLASAVGAFVEAVELAVLSDLLEGLAPEVMQALVDHFAGIGQPGRVEACVVHLSIMSLDLNQVIRLCEGCCLYSALTHIYNQMNDFRKPLLDLLAVMAGAQSWSEAQQYCYKLLVYLRCCFKGMTFPPGTGNLPLDPPGVRDHIKAVLLGTLLFVDKSDLVKEWQQSGGAAAAVAAALTSQTASTTSAAEGAVEDVNGVACAAGTAACPVLLTLCDPHPALQLLLAVDVPATVTVLAEATGGWDAVETDLRAAAGKPTSELESVLTATQVVVNALVTLLEAGRFERWQRDSTTSASIPATSPCASGSSVAMNYIIELLAAGRVTVKPCFVVRLLEHLVAQAQTAAAMAAAVGTQQTTADAAAIAAATAPFEQQFISIIQVISVQPATAQGLAPGQQQQQHGSAVDAAALNSAQAREALQLAKAANFLQAAATIHHLQGNYAAALACYLALAGPPAAVTPANSPGSRKLPQQQHAVVPHKRVAVFEYIEGFVGSSGLSPQVRQSFLSHVLKQVVQLIRLDPGATAALVLKHQPDQQVPVLLSLRQDPQLQFQFLKAAMQQGQLMLQQGSGSMPPIASSSLAAGVAKGPSAAAAVSSGGSLLERPEVAILYVQLLARFEPSEVLPFLQSHHNYSVADAIKACQAAGVRDAEAFLYERLGDLEAAMRLYTSSINDANSRLEHAVTCGRIPVLLLPTSYLPPGWRDGSNSSSSLHQDRSSSSVGRRVPEVPCQDDDVQVCWGLRPLVQQLEAVASLAKTAMAAAGNKNGHADAQLSPSAADIQQASQELVEASACVAATLLQLLDPSGGSVAKGQHRFLLHSDSSNAAGASQHGPAGSSTSVSNTAAALQPLPPPLVDLYKSWMAELSPRLRLKGVGATAGAVAATPASAGMAGKLLALSSSSGSSLAAAGAAHTQLPGVPSELLLAWQGLQAALAFCQRNTSKSTDTSSQQSSTSGGKQLWFELMDVYVGKLRSLHGSHPQAMQRQQHQQQLCTALTAAAARQLPLQELPQLMQAAVAAVATTHMLPELFRLLLDELVCVMADHLPLLDIVSRVIQQHGSERFGEFRSTLLGLFGATAYDSAIMAAANRLITGDAFAAVRRAYGLRQLARDITKQQQEQETQDGTSRRLGSSTAAAAVPATALEAGALSAPADAVKSAFLLGLLGRGSPYDGDNGSSSSHGGGLQSLTHSDKELLHGILGSGGMRLQLQPAGPAAGHHLPGVAAEYKVAAQAVADTGHMFQGEMDLVLEMAVLQSLQEHQQHQRRQQHQEAQHTHADNMWGGGRASGHTASPASGTGTTQQPGAAAVASGGAARQYTSTSSFDIDELLTWSHKNM